MEQAEEYRVFDPIKFEIENRMPWPFSEVEDLSSLIFILEVDFHGSSTRKLCRRLNLELIAIELNSTFHHLSSVIYFVHLLEFWKNP